jgi:hypothetical protein
VDVCPSRGCDLCRLHGIDDARESRPFPAGLGPKLERIDGYSDDGVSDMTESETGTDRSTWPRENAQALVEEIKVLAKRARAAGFQTTEYILNLAVAELWKDIEREKKDAEK